MFGTYAPSLWASGAAPMAPFIIDFTTLKTAGSAGDYITTTAFRDAGQPFTITSTFALAADPQATFYVTTGTADDPATGSTYGTTFNYNSANPTKLPMFQDPRTNFVGTFHLVVTATGADGVTRRYLFPGYTYTAS